MIEIVSDRVTLVRADNPGIMTLGGTNTWILRDPDAERSIVVDPGPLLQDHLSMVHTAAGQVALVLFTHRHDDHTASLEQFCALTGAPTRAIDPVFCRNGEPLTEGEVLEIDGLSLEVVVTPGHTDDSVCFRLIDENTLLSGDTILGRGTTVVAHPDGALGPYLDSLAHLRELVEEGIVLRILPGHGPVIEQAGTVIDQYIDHRHERLDQVREALAAGDVTPRQVVERVYADVDQALWGAAELSVAAQLEYLRTMNG